VSIKYRFVGCRFEPKSVEKIIALSMLTDKPGDMSNVLRKLVDDAPMPIVIIPQTKAVTSANGFLSDEEP
jgi:hypothetical protein